MAINSDFLILISLQPNLVNLRYFKLWILLVKIFSVWNIKGLIHSVAQIWGFKIWVCVKNAIPFKRHKKGVSCVELMVYSAYTGLYRKSSGFQEIHNRRSHSQCCKSVFTSGMKRRLQWIIQSCYQGCNARKVNCSFVYSAYILKPVLFRWNL